MKTTITFNLKPVSIICAFLLFIAVLKLPIEYYTFLRIVIFIGSLLVIVSLLKQVIWVIIFSIIAILFNPIIPIYLYHKSYWIPIDIIAGILFLLILFFNNPKEGSKKTETKKQREFKRDKIY
ncbi:hypothetical protein Q4Q35_07615 [Flavivirga aquimarina]|uniref:Uncharacterized protein n=1 Tax=Flavivirga aquimarina TaxID=2027862 RepID=A0ABT8W9C4_9FLAO|nr:DUF6804 family protein [Flavivirga aquimarina]MDO5969671.1 hypothetical protein [Flavivirga aquimarina]